MANPLQGRNFIVVGPATGDVGRWHVTECRLFSDAAGGRVIELHDPACEVRFVGAAEVILDWLVGAAAAVLERQLAGEGEQS